MEKKGRLIVISMLVGLIVFMIATSASAQETKPGVIRWRGQLTFAPAKTPFGPYQVGEAGVGSITTKWSEWLKSASGGRLLIDWAEPGAIFPVTDSDTAVAKNVVQIASAYGSYYSGRIPETDVETGGVFLWENEAQCYECLHKYGLYPALQKVYAKHNLKWLPNHSGAIVGLMANFQAPNPEALKGKKIRAIGMWADYAKLLGASPVTLSWGEMYMGMKLGTMDGIIAGHAILEELKIKEVAKSIVINPVVSPAFGGILINMDAFNALPKDLQILLERDTPHVTYALSTLWTNQCTWVIKHAQAQYGLKVYNWTTEDVSKITKQVADEIYPKIAARTKESGELMEIVNKQMRNYGRMK